MKSLHRHLLTAGLLAGIGIAAVAQTQTPPAPPAAPNAPHMQGEHRGHHGDPAQFRARMEERMARRLGQLKAKLQISPAQEGAWSSWTTAMKPTQFQRPDRAEFQRLSTPERIDRIRAQRAQRNAAMDQRFDATKTFYAALNAEQKKVFDAEAMRFMRGGRHGGRGHGGRHQRS